MPPDFDAGLIAYKHRSVSSCHFCLHENRLLFLVEREKQQEGFLDRKRQRPEICLCSQVIIAGDDYLIM